MEHLREMGQQAQKQQSPLALLLLDLRRFKEINDLYGHQIGDQLLATVAEDYAIELPGVLCAAFWR